MMKLILVIASLLITQVCCACIASNTLSQCTPSDSGSYVNIGPSQQFQAWTATTSGIIESISIYLTGVTPGTVTLSLNSQAQPAKYPTVDFTSSGVYTFEISGGFTFVENDQPYFYILSGPTTNVAVNADGDCLGELISDKRLAGSDVLYAMVVSCGGSSGGDPHFYGFQGQKVKEIVNASNRQYDVMGQSFEIYNIITAPYLQINSQFIPYYKTATQIEPTGTMMGDLGFQFNGKTFYINSNSTFGELGNQAVAMTTEWELVFDKVVLSNKINGRMYEITLKSEDIEITFIRKVYKISQLPDQWHFDYRARYLSSNENFHGLLGQTWEDKSFAEKQGAFKLLDGQEDDYRIKSNNIFGNDFKFNKYQSL